MPKNQTILKIKVRNQLLMGSNSTLSVLLKKVSNDLSLWLRSVSSYLIQTERNQVHRSLLLMVGLFLIYAGPVLAQGIAEPSLETESFWLWRFLGRLHPLIVHFPIALVMFAAFLELFTLGNFHSKLRSGISLMILAGTGSTVIAIIFGLLLADTNEVTGSTLDLHQWTGLGTGVLCLIVLYLIYYGKNRQSPLRIRLFRASLIMAALGVGITGHFGASLTHGEDFITETLPWEAPVQETAFGETRVDLAAFDKELNPAQELELIGQVRMVLAHNCYKCHSSAKVEGKLRLDEKEYVFEGGKTGPAVVPGDPAKSELIARINLPEKHRKVMPQKAKPLTEKEKALLTLWVEKGAVWPEGASQQSVYRVAELAPRKPSLPAPKEDLENPVDLWVDSYFQSNGLSWGEEVDDRTYLRRISLDVIGLIPSPEELEAFVSDSRQNKREVWLQALLDRKDDYATHWLTFWNDALRNDYTGTGYITGGRFNITDWLYTAIRDNKPYDQFVKQLLNPDEKSKGFIEGIRWRGTVNASQRTEMQAAQNVGQVILGLNLKCASCHDSFISDWKLEEAYAFANIFADTTLEVSRCEQPTGTMAKTKILWEELGEIDSMATRAEKLRQLADRLVQPENGRMYRTIVNRVWKQLMGRGIVEPVDEMDNLPWSQDLLDWLAVDFVESGYDLKQLIHQIASSKIYRSQSVGTESADQLMAEDYQFKGLVRRRMTAEQFSDAVSQLIHPLFEEEERKYRPYELLAGEIPGKSFARASLVANNAFLTALGRPNREIVSTSRDSQASLLQALELTNGERLNSTLRKGAETWKSGYPDPVQLTERLYEKALNRKPNPEELLLARKALGESPQPDQIQDFFWAVLLLPEFQMIY